MRYFFACLLLALGLITSLPAVGRYRAEKYVTSHRCRRVVHEEPSYVMVSGWKVHNAGYDIWACEDPEITVEVDR